MKRKNRIGRFLSHYARWLFQSLRRYVSGRNDGQSLLCPVWKDLVMCWPEQLGNRLTTQSHHVTQ